MWGVVLLLIGLLRSLFLPSLRQAMTWKGDRVRFVNVAVFPACSAKALVRMLRIHHTDSSTSVC